MALVMATLKGVRQFLATKMRVIACWPFHFLGFYDGRDSAGAAFLTAASRRRAMPTAASHCNDIAFPAASRPFDKTGQGFARRPMKARK